MAQAFRFTDVDDFATAVLQQIDAGFAGQILQDRFDVSGFFVEHGCAQGRFRRIKSLLF